MLAMSWNFVASRRLTSALHGGAADNFLSTVAEIDADGDWMAVALALAGDVASLAVQAHGDDAQHWLDARLARLLDSTTSAIE